MKAFLFMCYNIGNGGAFGKRMVQSLEQYIAEATNAYKPASTAIQTQLGSLQGQLDTTNAQINRNYAEQQKQLESQRNQAAEAASLQAAGSGGSFGGAANIANRKYYEQSFVPAQTRLQTNQANDLAQARQNIENQRTSLNAQLANLEAQANQSALSNYYNALEAEKAREAQIRAQREATAAQNSYWDRIMEAQRNNIDKSGVNFVDWLNKYSGESDNTKNYWTNKLQQASNMGGLTGTVLKNSLNLTLQASPIYRQYLNWRNS